MGFLVQRGRCRGRGRWVQGLGVVCLRGGLQGGVAGGCCRGVLQGGVFDVQALDVHMKMYKPTSNV